MKRFLLPLCGLLLSSLLLFACASDEGGSSAYVPTTSGEYGAIAFSVAWPDGALPAQNLSRAATVADLVTMRVTVSGPGMANIVRTFPYADHAATITGVPVGSGREVLLQGLDATNANQFEGRLASIDVVADQTNQGGLIQMRRVQNLVPVANAGADQNVLAGIPAILNGSASTDADLDTLTYSWSFISSPAGSNPILNNVAVVNPRFSPALAGVYVLELTVNDGNGGSATDRCTITAFVGNLPPIANAGIDQIIAVNATATLDGSASSDGDSDPLTYSWSFAGIPNGSFANLLNPTQSNPQFTADVAGDYVVELIVNDGTDDSAADTVTVIATNDNFPPVANAGADQNVQFGDTVTLDGSSSSDINGDALSYSWAVVSKPTGSLSTLDNATVAGPSFSVDRAGTYVFQLIVSDGLINSTPDTVMIDSNLQGQVSTSGLHTLMVKSDGSLWAWGNNQYGQYGNGTTTASTIPLEISPGPDWVAVAAGYESSVALKANGTLWTWGRNQYGQVGDGTTTDQPTATQLGTDTDWVKIEVGSNNCYAIKSDGTLWAWGYNANGQLGNGKTANELAPVQIGTDSNWKDISAAYTSCLALKTDGTLWSWGSGAAGKLGLGDTTNYSFPQQVGTDTDWKEISALSSGSLAIKTDGTLWAWGNNTRGELGNPSISGFQTTPVQVNADTDWKKLPDSKTSSFAIKTDGSLWGWGINSFGTLGNGSTADVFVPTQIATNVAWASLASGRATIAMANDGTLYGWGENIYGQVGDGSTVSTTSPVNINDNIIIADAKPVAVATVSVTVIETNAASKVITLDGSGSYDPESNPLTYSWSVIGQPAGSGANVASATSATTTITPDIPGTYTVQLIVGDGAITSIPKIVSFLMTTKPTANISTPLNFVALGSTTTFYGTASADPDGDSLSYLWELTSKPVGSTAVLSTTTADTTTLVADITGDYTVKLTVADGNFSSTPVTLTVTGSASPVAAINASNSVVETGSTVALDGSLSNDPDGGSLTYTWVLESAPTGSVATLSNSSAVNPNLTLDVSGNYVVSLVVNDGTQFSAKETLTLTANSRPTAIIAEWGSSNFSTLGFVIFKDSTIYVTSNSVDPESAPLTNTWALTKPSGSTATLSPASPTIQQINPDIPGNYTISLTVNDGTFASPTNSMSFVVTAAPVASCIFEGLAAEPSATAISVNQLWNAGGQTITVDCTSSYDLDGDPITFNWSVANVSADTTSQEGKATFVVGSPSLDPQINLTVTDGVNASSSFYIRYRIYFAFTDVNGNQLNGLAVTEDGGLFSWGFNDQSQLGIGTSTGYYPPPIERVGTDLDWLKVSAGGTRSAAIKNDGTLWIWGDGAYGFGDGTAAGQSDKAVPTNTVAGLWNNVSTNDRFTLAIRNDGTLWGWGSNNWLTSSSTYGNVLTATQIGADSDWSQVWADPGYTAYAVKNDGSLWAWGYNSGKYGNGTVDTSTTGPVNTGLNVNEWIQLSFGEKSVLGVKLDGTLWVWGPTPGGFASGSPISPKQFGIDSNWTGVTHYRYTTDLKWKASISSGGLAIKADGSLWIGSQIFDITNSTEAWAPATGFSNGVISGQDMPGWYYYISWINTGHQATVLNPYGNN